MVFDFKTLIDTPKSPIRGGVRKREGIEARSQVVGLVFARRRDIASTEK